MTDKKDVKPFTDLVIRGKVQQQITLRDCVIDLIRTEKLEEYLLFQGANVIMLICDDELADGIQEKIKEMGDSGA